MSKFHVLRDGDRSVIQMDGFLIVGNREMFKVKALREVDDGVRNIVLDFSETKEVDPSGLGVMVTLYRRLKDVGGTLGLRNLNEGLREYIRNTRLDTIFTIVE